MKKMTKIILLGIVCSICILYYLKYDSKQYYYGWDCAFCNKTLPYNLDPNDYYDRSFTLMDDDGFELVGIGFKYRRSDFKIKNILGYGYNDTSIVAKVTDSLNNIKYLSSYETKYKNNKGNPEISFEDMSKTKFEQVKKIYNWVDLNEEELIKTRRYKTLSLTGAIISLLLLLWQLIRKRKVTQ